MFRRLNFFGKKFLPTGMGFEPTRAEHIGLAVQRLNHSATSSVLPYGPIKPFLQVSPWVSEDGEVTVEIEEAAEELPKIGAELAMMQMSETFHTKIIIISQAFLYVLQAHKDLHRSQWHCTTMHFFSTWILVTFKKEILFCTLYLIRIKERNTHFPYCHYFLSFKTFRGHG